MKIKIKFSKISHSDAIKEYAEEKINMLDKYLGEIKALNCDVEVSKEAKHQSGNVFRAEINLELPGTLLRVEKTAEDMYKAIDKAKEHLVRSIIDYKEKRRN